MKSHTYIISEIASTHEGDYAYLRSLIKDVASTGADAIKFQIFRAEEVVDPAHPDFGDLERYQFTAGQWSELIMLAREYALDVWVVSSGDFSRTVIHENRDHIHGIELHASDVGNIVMLEFANECGKPMILSCAGATLSEIIEALDVLDKDRQIILMHGFQGYPTHLDDLNIGRIRSLKKTFPFHIGFADHISGDHPMSVLSPLLAVGAGADVVEKHITRNRAEKRDDYFSSLDPQDFKRMVELLRQSDAALGTELFRFSEAEIKYRRDMKKKIKVMQPIAPGEVIRRGQVAFVRNAEGTEPVSFGSIQHKPVKTALIPGTFLRESHLRNEVGVFVNARLHSTRLPRKALKPFYGGMTTIEYLLKRLTSYSGDIGRIVFATSTEEEDAPLVDCARNIGVDFLRGDPLDIMLRMLQVVDQFGFTTLVRVTGDDILVSGEYIEKALEYHFERNLEYTRIAGLAYGAECEIIDTSMLKRIYPHVVHKKDTEYLTWFLDGSGVCKTDIMQARQEDQRPDYRLTLDYQEDFDLMRDLVEQCHPKIEQFYIPLTMINQYLDGTHLNVPHTDAWQKISREDIDVSLNYQFERAAR
ncbi:MAG: N-acetylneuraminate synthase family protein [Candidatus Omnitrophica bacterium]|nr:N-acetylneuraminate synthase family protein [Candidatus Omnitrophota bacterium]